MLLPFPSLQLLKDLPHRVSVSADLAAAVEELCAAAPAPDASKEEMRAFVERTLRVTDLAVARLDLETATLTHKLFEGNDPASLRQRLLTEPKKMVDQSIAGLKQKLASERSDWARRLAKQSRDVRAALLKELAEIQIHAVPEGSDMLAFPTDEWTEAHRNWVRETFDEWSRHLRELLRNRYGTVIRGELEALGELAAMDLEMELPPPPALAVTLKVEADSLRVTFAPPTALDSIFATFKNGLNTVAMMAGLVVVPVVGTLMNESPDVTRAMVMGALVVPVLVFAVLAGLKARRKLQATLREGAKDEIGKKLEASFTAQLERFRSDAERSCGAYGQRVLDAAVRIAERATSKQLVARERTLADELAAAQLEIDRVNERIAAIRQAKAALTNELRLDLVHRLED